MEHVSAVEWPKKHPWEYDINPRLPNLLPTREDKIARTIAHYGFMRWWTAGKISDFWNWHEVELMDNPYRLVLPGYPSSFNHRRRLDGLRMESKAWGWQKGYGIWPQDDYDVKRGYHYAFESEGKLFANNIILFGPIRLMTGPKTIMVHAIDSQYLKPIPLSHTSMIDITKEYLGWPLL